MQAREEIQDRILIGRYERVDLFSCFHRNVEGVLRVVAARPIDPLIELMEVKLAALAAAEQRSDVMNVVKEALQTLKRAVDVLRSQVLHLPQMTLRGFLQCEGWWSAHSGFTCAQRGKSEIR